MLERDTSPTMTDFSAEACDFLATHPALFQKFSEPFLCLVGLSRYYDLDHNIYPTFLTATREEMDLFAFIRHADPTKVWIDDHDGQNDNIENLNEESVVMLIWKIVPRKVTVLRRVVGASGSDHPPKKLKEDHGTSGDDGASTGGKSLATLYGSLERSTLAVEVGVTAATTMLFVTSFVTPTPEREGGGNTDSISRPNLRTQRPYKRFVISLDSSHHSSTNDADAEVTSLVKSFVATSDDDCECRGNFFERKCARQADVLKEMDVKIANLKAQLSLKEAEVTEVIHLPLEEEKNALEGKVTTLESTAIAKETELASLTAQTAKLTQDISSMELSCDELGVKAASLEAVIGLAIDKGIQDGLVAGIDHGKAEGLKSQKDASIADIMSLLRLEGPSAVTLDVSRLQPLYEQLLLPIHRKEDNVVIKETSLSDSLNVVHARVQKLKEASTLGVPITAAATTTLAISVNAANISPIPPISMADYDLFSTGVWDTTPHSPKIVFKLLSIIGYYLPWTFWERSDYVNILFIAWPWRCDRGMTNEVDWHLLCLPFSHKTPGSAITILETANEFAINGNHLTLVKGNKFDGEPKLILTNTFTNSSEYAICLNTEMPKMKFEITQEVLNAAAGGIFLYKTPNQAYQLFEDKVLLKLDWAKKQKTKSSCKKTVAFADKGGSNSDTDKIMPRMDAMTLKIDAQYKELQSNAKKQNPILMKMTYLSLPSNTQPNLKGHNSKAYQPSKARNEHVNAVFIRSGKSYNPPVNPNDQQENSEILINFDSDDEDDEPTPQPKTQNPKPAKETSLPNPYKQKILYPQCLRKEKMEAQYGKFLDMIHIVRINIYHIDVLAEMPNYGKFLNIDVIGEILEEDFDALLDEEPFFLPVVISSQLSKEKKNKLISILKKHKQAFSWKTTDIHGICPSFYKHKIELLDDKKPVVQKQRRLNPNMQEVVKKEIMKLLDSGIFYPIADSPWVSPIYCVPKKGSITIVTNENDELVPTRFFTGWRVCIDYRKLNEATAKDHFPLSFMDQITYAYRRMPFGLCNAPATFQRCVLAIFHDMIEESVEVFMDDFFVFRNSLETCLNNLYKMLQHCKDTHLVLNSEKCHLMVKEGIVLGHKIARPLTKLLEKDTTFEFDDECQKAFELLKVKLTCAPIIVSPNWNLPFELMCDASDFAVEAILGQKDGKNFHPIYFTSKTLNPAQQKYTVIKKELMAIVFAFDKFRSYLILSKTISRFMHGITNPELIKRLHNKISKSVDEMMRITTSFLGGGKSWKPRVEEVTSAMEATGGRS
nr:DNA-directed DNA polymerase [Tanacetum cinerariifolium]